MHPADLVFVVILGDLDVPPGRWHLAGSADVHLAAHTGRIIAGSAMAEHCWALSTPCGDLRESVVSCRMYLESSAARACAEGHGRIPPDLRHASGADDDG